MNIDRYEYWLLWILIDMNIDRYEYWLIWILIDMNTDIYEYWLIWILIEFVSEFAYLISGAVYVCVWDKQISSNICYNIRVCLIHDVKIFQD